jgi:hypothetical protein
MMDHFCGLPVKDPGKVPTISVDKRAEQVRAFKVGLIVSVITAMERDIKGYARPWNRRATHAVRYGADRSEKEGIHESRHVVLSR